MNKLLLAGLAAGAWSSGALAADLGPYTPPPAEPIYEPVRERGAWNWQGLYFGVNAGYGWGNDNSAHYSGLGESGTLNPSGWLGGGQIGYNAQFNWLVLGLEADLQGADIGDSSVLDSGFTNVQTDIDWFSTVRGRIGYAAGPTLVYFTGGWAFANLDQSLTSGAVSMSKEEVASGYTLGGGLEWQFAPNWSLKTEYLYVDLGEQTLSGPSGTYTTDTDFHTVRAGVNFRF
ncbi:MAG: outer membrane protein [Hyphomicrobium sp.]|jgi:outer membrane immunogenic protein